MHMPSVDDLAIDKMSLYMVALYTINNWSNPSNDLVKLLALWAACNFFRVANLLNRFLAM
jgi:hypothetical protein